MSRGVPADEPFHLVPQRCSLHDVQGGGKVLWAVPSASGQPGAGRERLLQGCADDLWGGGLPG